MWPSRSGAVPDESNVRRAADTRGADGRVSCFVQVNIRPQLWEARDQAAEA
jgi:hypothetical protein